MDRAPELPTAEETTAEETLAAVRAELPQLLPGEPDPARGLVLGRARLPGLRADALYRRPAGDATPGQRDALLCDACVRSRLAHPGVRPILGVFHHAPRGPVVLEPAIAWRPWAQPEVAASADRLGPVALLRVAEILAHIHEVGVAHAGLAPAVIWTSPEWGPVLGDFDRAVRLDGRHPDLPRRRSEPTVHRGFAAPEELLGEPLAAATDVYRWGACLYWVLTGHPPHEGAELRAGPRGVERPSLPLPPDTPRALRKLIEACMAPNPEERPASDALRPRLQAQLVDVDEPRLRRVARHELQQLERAVARAGRRTTDAAEIYAHLGACRVACLQLLHGEGDLRAPADLARAYALVRRFERRYGSHEAWLRLRRLEAADLRERGRDAVRGERLWRRLAEAVRW